MLKLDHFSFSHTLASEINLFTVLFLNMSYIFSSRFLVLSPVTWHISSFPFSHISGYISIMVQYKSLFFHGSSLIPPTRRTLLLLYPRGALVPSWAEFLQPTCILLLNTKFFYQTKLLRAENMSTSVTFSVPLTLEMPPNGHE